MRKRRSKPLQQALSRQAHGTLPFVVALSGRKGLRGIPRVGAQWSDSTVARADAVKGDLQGAVLCCGWYSGPTA